MKSVVVIDYGMGNLKSVQRGLEKVGASVILSSDPMVIANAGRLVLPGVGAFEDGMKGLRDAGVIDAINDFVKTGNELLGICLGMQMLLDQSEEHGNHDGLGLIPGDVKEIPKIYHSDFIRKIPHIGWVGIEPSSYQDWKGSCLEGIEPGEYFYFVHSFMAVTEKKENLLAQCEDERVAVSAAIKKDNVTGLQFHPEKSGGVGLKILDRFMTM
jgi:imidazole glycerol-phosphate synthase subunit HisH